MAVSLRRFVALVAVLAGTTTCLPEFDPIWLIQYPTLLAVRTEVIAGGIYSKDVPAWPSTHTRAQALPLDTVRLVPFIAGPQGPLDLTVHEPLWLAGVMSRLQDGLGKDVCERIPLDLGQVCQLQQNAELIATLDDVTNLGDITFIFDRLIISLVGSTTQELSNNNCLNRILGAEEGPLWDCILAQDFIPLGPLAQFLVPASLLGIISLPVDGLPPELLDELPNLNPRYEGFFVKIESEAAPQNLLLASGDSFAIQRGDRVSIRPLINESEQQNYTNISAGGDTLLFTAATETLTGRWYASENIAESTYQTSAEGMNLSFTARGTATELYQYFVLRDERGGVNFGWLHIHVEDPG